MHILNYDFNNLDGQNDKVRKITKKISITSKNPKLSVFLSNNSYIQPLNDSLGRLLLTNLKTKKDDW